MPQSILDLIAETITSGSRSDAEIAHKWGLLPVYGDMGGTLALDAEGDVYLLLHDDSGPPQRECRPEWRLMALAAAVTEYPDLQHLKPVRPATAMDCVRCQGTGRGALGNVSWYCGACAGMGWYVGAPFEPKGADID